MMQKGYAVTFTAREQAALLEIDPPPAPPGPREVMGRTLATAISPGTEIASGYIGDKFPNVPGYAAVFEVEEAGSEVEDIKAGDHVFCTGPHRSFQRFGRDEVLPLPAGLSPHTAVFARFMSVSMSTLTTTRARPPAKVLVTGLGLIGHMAAKVFDACGYEVYACDPSSTRRSVASVSGIKNVLPAVPVEDAALAGRVALAVDCSGHEAAALDGCRIVRKRGEVVLIGTPWTRKTDLSAHEVLHAVFHRYVTLRSGWEWELPLRPADFRDNSIVENLAAALKWLAEGRVQVEGLSETMPPRQAQEAYQSLLHNRREQLTVVFDWTQLKDTGR